jgi:hypothetical protein
MLLRDLFPALAGHEQMRPPGELDELGGRGRMPVLAEVGLGDGRREGVVVLAHGDEQRSAILALEVDLGRPAQGEVRQAVLEEDAARLRNGVALEGLARVGRVPGVGERVVELLEVEVDDATALAGVRDRRSRGAEAGERRPLDTLRRGCDRSARGCSSCSQTDSGSSYTWM